MLQSLPFISIIIPNYNNAGKLIATINSCLSQTYPNFEIIIIDDFSTDNSLEILNAFRIKFPNKIHYFLNNQKGGNNARILGFKKSKGDYIQWLDSDDVILPEKLETQLNYLNKNPKIDVVYSDFRIDTHWVTPIKKEIIRKADYDDFTEQILADNWSPPHNYLFKRSVVEKTILANGWNTETYILQDREFVTVAAILGAKFAYVPGVFSIYNRWDKQSVSQKQKFKKLIAQRIVLNQRFYKLISEQTHFTAQQKQRYFQLLDTELVDSLYYLPNAKISRKIAFDKVDKNRLSAKKRKLLPLLRLYRKVSA